jgi:hypothetical protein
MQQWREFLWTKLQIPNANTEGEKAGVELDQQDSFLSSAFCVSEGRFPIRGIW